MRWPWSKPEAEIEPEWSWPAGEARQYQAQTFNDDYSSNGYTGANFWGAVSGQIDQVDKLDYWTLRQRSAALFYSNTYGRGIIRRLVTNVIHTGLEVECTPEESILGLPEDSLVEWSEEIENRYHLYNDSKEIIDAKGYRNGGAIQRQIYLEALVCGDCLVINRIDKATGLPQLQIVNGDRVRTPFSHSLDDSVVDGVKLDKRGRHLGYWVYLGTNEIADEDYIYVPARGTKTKRRTAWMVYGPDKREDGVRGEPLLGIAIQPLKEISDFRGSAQRKASINSMIVGFIKRTQNLPMSSPLTGGAVRKTAVTPAGDSTDPALNMTEVLPGMFMERLLPGEEPVPHSIAGTDVNFGPFEAAILTGLAWSMEIPPEVLMMTFEKNYSASQAANNEWKIYVSKERPRFAGEHCENLFEEWFVSELLNGKIKAPGFLEAYFDPGQYDVRKAWLLCDWIGSIKPSVDIVKTTAGYKAMTSEGWITNDRAARETTGSKFSKNIRRLEKENEMKMRAILPILKAKQEFGEAQVDSALGAFRDGELLAMASAQTDDEKENLA